MYDTGLNHFSGFRVEVGYRGARACVCVCVCVRARARVCIYIYVCVCVRARERACVQGMVQVIVQRLVKGVKEEGPGRDTPSISLTIISPGLWASSGD